MINFALQILLGWWHPVGQTQDPKSADTSLAPRKFLAHKAVNNNLLDK